MRPKRESMPVLWHDPYDGFFSASADKETALHFLEAGPVGPYSVLLTIHALPGLLGVPASVLGPDSFHEAEVLIARQTPFCIQASRRKVETKRPYLDLELVPTGLS